MNSTLRTVRIRDCRCSHGLLAFFLTFLLLSSCSSRPVDDASAMLVTAAGSVVAVGHNGSTIGTAFALAPNHFATSHHIAAKAPIYLLDNQGNPVPAKLVAADSKRDIAIVQARLAAPSLSGVTSAAIGTTIYALGNPFGSGLTVTRGIVSAHPQSIRKPDLLQIDAAINPGNSGGPVVNSAGQVIGLVSSRAKFGSGIAFAVPYQHLQALLATALGKH